MEMRYFFTLLVAGLLAAGQLTAKTAKKQKTYFKLVEAYTQQTRPGIPGAAPKTNHHFIIIWDAPRYPETFSWRGEDGWLSCNMTKVHKITGKRGNIPMGIDYIKENVAANKINKGDTLELIPIINGQSPTPEGIPATAKNTLFFKTGGSGWMAFPVKSIGRKQDIAMP